MIKKSKLITPTPVWCLRNALACAPSSYAIKAALDSNKGTVFSDNANGRWNGSDFWRELRVFEDRVEIEFNENFIERYSNQDWQWHTISRKELGL